MGKKGGKKGGKGGAPKAPPPPPLESINLEEVYSVVETVRVYDSPINLQFEFLKPGLLPPLEWMNYATKPHNLKVTNSGNTVVLSGRWGLGAHPFLVGGPLRGEYVFSQMHIHWGPTSDAGSEHTVNNIALPMELHAVFHKRAYQTHDEARKHPDGLIIVAYLCKIQPEDNIQFDLLVRALPAVRSACGTMIVDSVSLSYFLPQVTTDYFMYWGSISLNLKCSHTVLWIVSRQPIGVSERQVNEFRYLLDCTGKVIGKNFRAVQPISARNVYHVNPGEYKDNILMLLPHEAVAKPAGKEKKGGKKGKGKKK